MKKLLLNLIGISLLLFCITNNSKAQWQLQNNAYATDIKAVDNNNIWITGYAGFNDGYIARSTNGGLTWSTVLDNIENVNAIDVVGTNTVYVAGYYGYFYKTTNGGVNWATGVFPNISQYLSSVDFIDANTGWVVGESIIFKTTDGGTTWNTQPDGTTNLYYEVHFFDLNKGWVVGQNGTILHTTNGGTTWSTQTSGTSNDLYSAHFIDANNGWAVGGNGTILHTSNGGTSWSQQTSGITSAIRDVQFVDGNTGWAVASGTNSGVILKTTNGGSTWNVEAFGSLPNFGAVSFVDSNKGWACGSGNSATGIYLYSGSPSNIQENNFINSIQVYPNPSEGLVTMQFEEMQNEINISVYSIDGRILQNFTKNQMDNFSFEIDEPAGLYLVEIINDKNEKATFRLIKE